MRLRHATLDDVPALEALIRESVWALQRGEYTDQQISGALGTIYGTDRNLINDGTFFVVEAPDSSVAACGGWSCRKTAFGSDSSPVKDDSFGDPAVDPARIRGFFVHPAWSRKGLGTRILQACESAAIEAGFTRAELVATVTGVALYARHGYSVTKRYELDLPNGFKYPAVGMAKSLLGEIVRHFYAARKRGDEQAIRSALAEKVVWHEPPTGEFTGDLHGRDAVLRMMREASALTAGTFSLDVHQVMANRSHAVALVNWSASKGETLLEGSEFAVFRFDGTIIAEVWFYQQDMNMDRAFWAAHSG